MDKKKISLVVPQYLQNDIIFKENYHRDNIYDRFIKLKKEFLKYGYFLATNDINKIDESDIVLYASNMPKLLPLDKDVDKSYVILTESHFIRPDNYDKEKHKFFEKVFTWFDDYVDGDKYIKLNYANYFPDTINKDLSKKEKLCTLIAGNKNAPFSKEKDLYSKRREAIRWFEQNHPEDFDLYGVGWDSYHFTGNKFLRYANHIPNLGKLYTKLTGQTYPSYKGKVDNKKETMEKYKFSICYENARDIPGYITEKIFDSFIAGCIPVYWGPENILDYVLKECFIDKRDFDTYEELYSHMIEMADDKYMKYLNNIEKYLNSKQAFQFKSEGFVKTIVETIMEDIDGNK